MRAMILAAGRGSRMQHLTEHLPKPLLPLGNKTLIDYQLGRLQRAGITDCLINVRYHADKIQTHCGSGEKYGINITYSVETQNLETAGGIINALPYFNNEAFVLISCDVLCDYPLQQLSLTEDNLAHCVLVDNPEHNQQGDFALNKQWLTNNGRKLTYANQGIYHPQLFTGYPVGFRKLRDILIDGIEQQTITGEYYQGQWLNIDTPERLATANNSLLTINRRP